MTDWNNEKQCLEALKIDDRNLLFIDNQNLEMCLMAVENSKPSENFDEYDIEDSMLPEFRDSKIIKKAILEAKIKTL